MLSLSAAQWRRPPLAGQLYGFNNTFTPGSVLPSSDSRNAPPPVQTCVMRSLTAARLSAATVSPPPAKLTSFPAAVSSAAASATSIVPLSNGSCSKAPNGPFQTRVLLRASTETTCSMLRGPMSRTMTSAPIWSTGTTREGACSVSCGLDQVSLIQGFADRFALRDQKRIRHGAADDQCLDFAEQVAEKLEPGGDFGTAYDRSDWMFGMFERPR